ncbi:putative mitochondrial carrier protein pet8 protein [Lasiodiplodia theobromae]|uniref:Mitochondrial ATPase inhibitor n=1 Tax=Lasiodiplodia theobromae TaxID=45133 RepID=A0A5N5DKW0_9PEZI|nr:hypothetical protein DBV05_g3911 [Lasiodiplodia theobromae]KAF9640346.1 putative mitochondrial carrier protein pet8 protein [Lasiodiplodia theobromae]
MSAIRNLARVSRTPIFAAQRMGFQTSTPRFAGKETKLHDEGRHQEVEEHKQDLLKKSKEGKGHWKDELASDSESIIKADRGEIEASQETIEKLQKETEKLAQKKK